MKLIIAIVQGEDAQTAMQALTDKGISSTRISSYPVEVQVGGATVFVVPVDSFEKI